MVSESGVKNSRSVTQQDMHEAYQCLLKVIRAKNRFKMKALEKLRNRSHLAEEDSEQKTDQIENKDQDSE